MEGNKASIRLPEDVKTIISALEKAGYEGILRDAVSLPNGKQFVRLDYKKKQ